MKQSKFNNIFNMIMQNYSQQNNIYYHISPNLFDKFLINKCGTGMSTSFWGYGIYLAKNELTIDYYYDQMKDSYPHLYKYTVKINCRTIDEVVQDYMKKRIPQNKNQKLIYKEDDLLANDKTVGEIYYQLVEKYGQKKASEIISNKYHVAGISYYTVQDENSLVVYDQNIIEIVNVQEIKRNEKEK